MTRYAVLGLLAVGLMCDLMGCCCFPPKMAQVESEVPIFQTPPAEPPHTEPPPASQPQPSPPVAVVPPTVAEVIQDLSDKYPGLFKFDKDKSLLYFNSDILFNSGSAVVKPDAKAALGRLARILNEDEVQDRNLIIIGHTDTDRVVKPATIDALKKLGHSADNMGLSKARSEAVAAVLQAGGIDGSRLAIEGKGSTKPVADNRTPEGKAQNRRVEIYLMPAAKL